MPGPEAAPSPPRARLPLGHGWRGLEPQQRARPCARTEGWGSGAPPRLQFHPRHHLLLPPSASSSLAVLGGPLTGYIGPWVEGARSCSTAGAEHPVWHARQGCEGKTPSPRCRACGQPTPCGRCLSPFSGPSCFPADSLPLPHRFPVTSPSPRDACTVAGFRGAQSCPERMPRPRSSGPCRSSKSRQLPAALPAAERPIAPASALVPAPITGLAGGTQRGGRGGAGVGTAGRVPR